MKTCWVPPMSSILWGEVFSGAGGESKRRICRPHAAVRVGKRRMNRLHCDGTGSSARVLWEKLCQLVNRRTIAEGAVVARAEIL